MARGAKRRKKCGERFESNKSEEGELKVSIIRRLESARGVCMCDVDESRDFRSMFEIF